MQQPDLRMALPLNISRFCGSPLISTRRRRAQLKPSYKNGSGGDGWARDSADIPLLGCSMRIHVPCCFTMEEKQRPPHPSRRGGGCHVGSAVERLRACLGCGGGMGRGSAECLSVGMENKRGSFLCLYDIRIKSSTVGEDARPVWKGRDLKRHTVAEAGRARQL